ncbi:MAG TPA: MBL fold metallo-hydrolase [Candidatus Paceibacterota bacterium]
MKLRIAGTVLILMLANAVLYGALLSPASHELRVSVLDVGQGDSILVQGPTGNTMLIDGGPDRTVLARLGEELGPLNRSLGLVVETHPDSDHITGLASVLANYRVAGFMEPGFLPATGISQELADDVEANPAIGHITARRGMRIDLGGGAYADVLSPDRDPEGEDTNEGSVVMHLVYGSTSFMLTGDLPSTHEDWLLSLDADDGELPTTVLKAGHHGSKYSTDDAWLAALHPGIVAISAGKDNRYGHPNPETLARIGAEGAAVLSTIDSGTLHFVSDGKTVTYK